MKSFENLKLIQKMKSHKLKKNKVVEPKMDNDSELCIREIFSLIQNSLIYKSSIIQKSNKNMFIPVNIFHKIIHLFKFRNTHIEGDRARRNWKYVVQYESYVQYSIFQTSGLF